MNWLKKNWWIVAVGVGAYIFIPPVQRAVNTVLQSILNFVGTLGSLLGGLLLGGLVMAGLVLGLEVALLPGLIIAGIVAVVAGVTLKNSTTGTGGGSGTNSISGDNGSTYSKAPGGGTLVTRPDGTQFVMPDSGSSGGGANAPTTGDDGTGDLSEP